MSKLGKARDVYYLLERAIEQFDENLHKAHLVKWQVGNRPLTVDGFPLIGETSIKGLWTLTGTYREGIHLSSLFAQSLAKEMLDQPALFDNLFKPERLPIQTRNKQEAIAETVKHYVSAGYEHAIKIPKMGWNNLIEELLHERISAVYNALDTDYGLPPDILIMLEQEPSAIPIYKKYYQSLQKLNLQPNLGRSAP